MQIRTLLCLVLLACTLQLMGQVALLESLTIEEGLSQGMVYDMVQTRDDYLWIATKDGLNRYDGYNFKVFVHDPFNPFTLTENVITALYEDSRGLLWVGTESKGLNVYDPKTGLFHHFSNAAAFKPGVANLDVMRMLEAPDGSMYVTQRGVGVLHIKVPAAWRKALPRQPELGKLAAMTVFPEEQFDFKNVNDRLVALELQPTGEVWVYSELQAYTMDTSRGFVKPVAAAQLPQASPPVYLFGAAAYRVRAFRNGQLVTDGIPPGGGIRTVVAKPTDNGGCWLATNEKLWYLEAGEFPDFERPDWILDRDISAVTRDRHGNIWVGTMGYGLRKINPKKQLFHKGADGVSIWGIWRDPAGRYYCKIFNEIFPYSPTERTLGRELAFRNVIPRVLDMCIEDSTTYWLLGRDSDDQGLKAICRYNPATKASACYPMPTYVDIAADPATSKAARKVPFLLYPYARILQDRSGNLWATGINGTLARFDTATRQFTLFSYQHVFEKRPQSITAFALAEDGNGHIWIGTQRGLVRGIRKGNTLTFELFETQANNPKGLSNNNILCLLPDPTQPKQTLWIGTKGGGINCLDLKTRVFTHINTQSGLPNDVVYGILPGDADELWCSTNRGLAKLTLDDGRRVRDITTFTAAKGLQDNEFNTQAFSKAANGELLFGGVNGINRFFPYAVLPDSTPSPLAWVGLSINHEAQAVPHSVEGLQLNANQNNLSFEFSLLDFTDPATNRYRYRLVGLDDDWVTLGTNRFCRFTNLAPGNYQLEVQGSNGEGGWQSLERPIRITVFPPWWRSTLAYWLYGILLTLAVVWGYRFQLRRIKMREQLAYEHRETERIRAMEQMKTNFFTNITHEFRTPLTLILEPARRIRQQTTDSEVRWNADLIARNSKRLLEMVNKLLDLAKIESGSMALELRRGDMAELAASVYQTFLPLAEQRNIAMSFSVQPRPLTLAFDGGKVELVLNNLLSNALKFTPEGGQVALTVRQVSGQQGEPDGVEITVADTGIGIPDEAVAHIFERFYQVENAQHPAFEGTGIGLALSKELTTLMNGRLSVDSNAGAGSVFTVWLPMVAPVEWETWTGAAQSATVADAASEPTLLSEQEQPLVLLIEDNIELRAFLKQCLASRWTVAEASDGNEGIQKARDLIPDLVISDLMMPGQDGYAVCQALKNDELTAHIPIILLTARQALDAKIKGLRVGADDYMAKPFHTEELLARMDNLVALRRKLLERSPNTEQACATDTDHLSELDQAFLRRFMALLEEHLADEGLSVEQLAQQMHISRVQLHRKLKGITQKNATDFLRDYRLDRAMAMLRNQEGLVYEIASQVGFGSEKYFSRAFKERFGISPSKVEV